MMGDMKEFAKFIGQAVLLFGLLIGMIILGLLL